MKIASFLRLAAGIAVGVGLFASSAQSAEPLVIHVGYAAIGVDNRPFSEGTSAATARAGEFLEKEFANDPDIKIEWTFFKGAGPAVNEGPPTAQPAFA